MADPELSALFPNLAASLDNWDGQQSVADDGHNDPSHGGVTDEQIEAELRRMGALRAPLSPLISGQQVPPTPEFARNGRVVPPGGRATVEPPQTPEEPETPPSETVGEDSEEVPGIPDGEEETPATPPPQPTALPVATAATATPPAPAPAAFPER